MPMNVMSLEFLCAKTFVHLLHSKDQDAELSFLPVPIVQMLLDLVSRNKTWPISDSLLYICRSVEILSIRPGKFGMASLCITEQGLIACTKGWKELTTIDIKMPTSTDIDTNDSINEPFTDLFLASVGESCPNLRSVKFNSCNLIGDEGITKLIFGCPLVESFSVPWCTKLTTASLDTLCGLNRLEYLDITGLEFSSNDLITLCQHFSESITGIDITQCPAVDSDCILDIFDACPYLTTISMGGRNGIGGIGSPESIEAISKKTKHRLTSVTIIPSSGCFIDAVSLPLLIPLCVGLKNLDLGEYTPNHNRTDCISNTATQSHALLQFLNSMTELRCLNLVGEIECAPLFGEEKESETLGVEENQPTPIPSNIPPFLLSPLHTVNFCWSNSLSDSHIDILCRSCGQTLTNLLLRCCRNLTDASCKSIGSFCKNLHKLNVERIPGITDVGLVAVSQGCQNLYSFYVSWCAISDRGITFSAPLWSKSMRKLNFSGCKQLSDEGVENLIKFIHEIEFLDLTWINNISDNMYLKILQKFPSVVLLDYFGQFSPISERLKGTKNVQKTENS